MSQARGFGCVLAGGLSTRMGQDKARLLWRGRTLVEHAVATLESAGCEVVIAGSNPVLAEYAPLVPDLHAGCGPLAGIEAALMASAGRAVLFAPVDLPMLPVCLIAMLLERAERTGAWATVPMLAGRPQPLCAVYRRELLGGVSAALEAGEYKVMRAIDAATPVEHRDLFGVEAVAAARGSFGEALPPHLWFANANTPDDWARLLQA